MLLLFPVYFELRRTRANRIVFHDLSCSHHGRVHIDCVSSTSPNIGRCTTSHATQDGVFVFRFFCCLLLLFPTCFELTRTRANGIVFHHLPCSHHARVYIYGLSSTSPNIGCSFPHPHPQGHGRDPYVNFCDLAALFLSVCVFHSLSLSLSLSLSISLSLSLSISPSLSLFLCLSLFSLSSFSSLWTEAFLGQVVQPKPYYEPAPVCNGPLGRLIGSL